jgi:hypothetical protein
MLQSERDRHPEITFAIEGGNMLTVKIKGVKRTGNPIGEVKALALRIDCYSKG